MSKFAKVYRKWHAKNNGKYDSAREYHKALMGKFGDWQPPKPPKPREIPVEIPQLVAVWFEDRMLGSFSAVVASYSFNDDEAITWVHDNGGIDLLCKMKLYGYTVEKEQLYVLELPRQYNPYVSQVNDFNVITRFAPLFYEAKRLSESEIKAIDERYWAFAVKVEEVEP